MKTYSIQVAFTVYASYDVTSEEPIEKVLVDEKANLNELTFSEVKIDTTKQRALFGTKQAELVDSKLEVDGILTQSF